MEFHRWLGVLIMLLLWNNVNSQLDILTDTDVPTNIAELEAKIMRLADSVLKQVFPLAVQFTSQANISMQCSMSFLRFFADIKTLHAWALRMLDASAKLPSSILQGTLTDFGGYDECLEVVVEGNKRKKIFEGQYCMIELRLPDYILKDLKELNSTGLTTSLWKVLQEFIGFGEEAAFRLGICVPSKCRGQDIKEIVHLVTRSFGIKVRVKCQTKTTVHPNIEQIIFLCLFGFIGFIVISGTIIDIIKQHTSARISSGVLVKLLIAFSLYSNTIQLFQARQKDASLSAIRGCRVLSAFWIVLGHTYFFPHVLHFLKYRRLIGLSEFVSELMFNTVINATVAVDTFFLLSGLLFVYTTWKDLEANNGWINPLIFFPIRMMRILPAQLLVIALFMILPLFGSGPIWEETFEETYTACKNNWWTNMLFIQNFWPIQEICLFHTWFIGVLFQIFIISFVFLIILYRWPKIGILLNILMIVSSSVIVVVLTSVYNLPSVFSLTVDISTWRRFFNIIYSRPYTYFSSYFIGMLLGYIIIHKRKPKIKPITQGAAWTLATISALSVLYCMSLFKVYNYRSLHLIYSSIHRPVWSLMVAWILYACINGYGGIISRFLSWKGMIPLDRIIYLVYLLHPLVMYYYTARSRAVIYMAHVEQVYIYLATVVITICLAYIFNVTVEHPFKYVESLVLKKLLGRHMPHSPLPTTIPQPQLTKCPPEITITPAETLEEENVNTKL